MAVLTNIEINLLRPWVYEIRWEYTGTPPTDDIIISHGMAENDVFTQILVVQPPIDRVVIEEKKHGINDEYYYKISYDTLYEPITYTEPINGVIAESRRLMQRSLMREYAGAGVPATYYRKKTTGAPCPVCWDDMLERETKGNCEACYGTGLDGGYYLGVDTYISFQLDQRTLKRTGMIDLKENLVAAWLTNYPKIKPGDVLKREDNKNIYEVQDPVGIDGLRSYRNGKTGEAVLRQILKLLQVEYNSILYKLEDIT